MWCRLGGAGHISITVKYRTVYLSPRVTTGSKPERPWRKSRCILRVACFVVEYIWCTNCKDIIAICWCWKRQISVFCIVACRRNHHDTGVIRRVYSILECVWACRRTTQAQIYYVGFFWGYRIAVVRYLCCVINSVCNRCCRSKSTSIAIAQTAVQYSYGHNIRIPRNAWNSNSIIRFCSNCSCNVGSMPTVFVGVRAINICWVWIVWYKIITSYYSVVQIDIVGNASINNGYNNIRTARCNVPGIWQWNTSVVPLISIIRVIRNRCCLGNKI